MADPVSTRPPFQTARGRLRRTAQYVFFPLDWVSYLAYSWLRAPVRVAPELDLPESGIRFLILSPHPDDEVLGCGGLMIRFNTRHRFQIAYMTDGRGRSHRSPIERDSLAERRQSEARDVCLSLNIEEPTFLNFPDGQLSTVPGVVSTLSRLIETTDPHVIASPFFTDGHPDHVATTRALAMVEPSLLESRQLLLYQVHSHIPDALLNRHLGLTAAEQRCKQTLLRKYVSQDFHARLTMTKYQMFNRISPQIRKRAEVVAVEHYSIVNPSQLRHLYRTLDVATASGLVRSINYSPYSFRLFLANRRALDDQFNRAPGN